MNFFQLVQQAKAQGADSVASATIPFTPPGGITPDPDPVTDGNTITIESDTTSVQAGDSVVVRIKVDSKSVELDGYTVIISFDPDYFQVVDADSDQTGIQIDYLDTVFTEEQNSVSNTGGIATLKVTTQDPSALSRTIAEINFIAKQTGSSEIKIVQQSSNLLSTQGIDVLDDVNSINFTISSQQVIIIEDEPTPIIPKTALGDYTSIVFGAIAGILLIIIGLYLRYVSKTDKKNIS